MRKNKPGAKPKYGEPTTPVVMRVPKSKVKYFRKQAALILKPFVKNV